MESLSLKNVLFRWYIVKKRDDKLNKEGEMTRKKAVMVLLGIGIMTLVFIVLQLSAAPDFEDASAEQALLSSLSGDIPWDVITAFSRINRESGSPEEHKAVEYLVGYLKKWGIPYKLYEPELFLSLPRQASVRVGDRTFRSKTPSMSASTGPDGLIAEVIYAPGQYATSLSTFFGLGAQSDLDVRGKIVLTEGMALPMNVSFYEKRGALGQIYINPGANIHEGICTTIWGAPDLDSYDRRPKTPIVSVNYPDGQELKKMAQAGKLEVMLQTRLEEGWKKCPVLVAEIAGSVEPQKFLLIHGHLDSWHFGVGDNATGDAALLELARVFWQHRDKIKRSLRVAWWSGHSHGRYAGSTWYADNFAPDLYENCIAQVNIDSPGCRWATEYRNVSWMSEAEAFCKEAIKDAVGKPSTGERPLRAGDYSFNNIGITSFYMLLSSMPESAAKEKGYYAVGGCGGNIAWHTEDDLLEIADKNNLVEDMKVYALSTARVLNAPILPFDFRMVTKEFATTLKRYQEAGGKQFDLTLSLEEVAALGRDLDDFYRRAADAAGDKAKPFNEAIVRLARVLVPINFTREGLFLHDPALEIPPLPGLAPIEQLGKLPPTDDSASVIRTHLTRGQNRLLMTLRDARRLVESVR